MGCGWPLRFTTLGHKKMTTLDEQAGQGRPEGTLSQPARAGRSYSRPQDGLLSLARLLVIWRSSLPSALMINISKVPWRSDEKAIH